MERGDKGTRKGLNKKLGETEENRYWCENN